MFRFHQLESDFFTFVPQVFTPTERIDNPLLITLVFCQVVQDVFSPACVRISKHDRMRIKSFLGETCLSMWRRTGLS